MFEIFKKKDNQEEGKEQEKSEKTEQKNQQETEIPKDFLSCQFIFEIIGKPADFIEKTLKQLMELLEKEKSIKIKSIKCNPPEAHKEKEGLFCVFSEVELFVSSLRRLAELIFDYMPSSIEVYEPSEIRIQAAECNSFINELATKLHQYDVSNKQLLYQRDIIFKKFQELKREVAKEKAEKKEANTPTNSQEQTETKNETQKTEEKEITSQ
ncbi:MAG: hypothetical protein NTX24_00210 [Candidatus Pacearchaeota archaeon]|nr:hypothetical protein [Candidatus Pacearchaeota archaeon]